MGIHIIKVKFLFTFKLTDVYLKRFSLGYNKIRENEWRIEIIIEMLNWFYRERKKSETPGEIIYEKKFIWFQIYQNWYFNVKFQNMTAV